MVQSMSFSGEVKEELVKQTPAARHCQLAELAALLEYTEAVHTREDGTHFLEIQQETMFVARKCGILLKNIFHIEGPKEFHHFHYENDELLPKVLQAVKYMPGSDRTTDSLVIRSLCCKRAFLRGAFLSVGSMSNPEKGYHLEFVCEGVKQAKQIQDTLAVFDVEAKVVARKKYQVVYLKEGEGIVKLLNIMGAHISLMKLENLRILKDMRNSINRRVNCEAANITKTVNAATKQIDDILYIRDHYGFDNLSEHLREIAEVRLDYPDATLKELGEYLVPQVGKSGVNHRLRKLSELADRLRT